MANLGPQFIKNSYQDLVQITASNALQKGDGTSISAINVSSITATSITASNVTSTSITSSDLNVQGTITQGQGTNATNLFARAHGLNTIASGQYSNAEGGLSQALGTFAHAEGQGTIALGTTSHAEGIQTIASGSGAHVEGSNTIARGNGSHAEGYETLAIGLSSHAEGYGTIAEGDFQHTTGQFNISSSAQSAFIIGNGTDDGNRSNLLFAAGSQVQITGSLNVSGSITSTNTFVQGGNSFGATALLGTNDNQNLQLETNGSVRMTISSSGNVGIGTISPSRALEIVNSSAPQLRIRDGVTGGNLDLRSSGDGEVRIQYAGGGYIAAEASALRVLAQGAAGLLLDTNGATKPVEIRPNGTTRLFVSSSGRVGIGTTTPTQRLDVRGSTIIAGTTPINPIGGTLEVYNNGSNAQITIHEDSGSAEARLAFRTEGSDTTFRNLNTRFSIDAETKSDALTLSLSGRVGIGTSTANPSSLLQVRGEGATSATTALRVENSSAAARLTILDNGTSAFNTNHLYVSGSGLVGIGTTTPGVTLDVVGNIRASSGMFNSLTQTQTIRINSTTHLAFQNTGSVEVARFDNAGNWGIGTTSPVHNLVVNGSTGISINANGTTFPNIHRDSSDGGMLLRSWNGSTFTNNVKITPTSNVGIGTTTPTQRLDVRDGFILVSGSGATGQGITIARAGLDTYQLTHEDGGLTIRNATDGVKEMTFLGNGNIGINFSSPLAKLHISGANALRMQNTGFDTFEWFFSAGTGIALRNVTDGTSPFFVGGTDNIGIGTTSPTSRLQVRGSGATSATTALRVENSAATARLTILDDGTSAFNTSHLYVSSSGRVAVGTSTPQRLFDVYNGNTSGIAASFGAQFGISSFSGISFGYVEQANSSYRKSALVFERTDGHGGGGNASGKIHFLLNNNSGTSATALTDAVLTIDSVGTTVGSSRVGIGTRFPTASLHISGTVATDNLMRVQSTTGAEYFFISASGNVGIGINTPGSQLHISGANAIMTLSPINPLPTTSVPSASFATSGSGADLKPYFWNGSTWTALF